MSGVLFGIAGAFHAAWMAETRLLVSRWTPISIGLVIVASVVLSLLAIALLGQVTRLAVWLTAKEGAFWGMRLPATVVRRALAFHAANYLPVAGLALAITGGYRALLMTGVTDAGSGVLYLYALCALVVVSAFWLFESYVIAMRRIRLANY